MAIASKTSAPSDADEQTSVLRALRTPRILTREVLAGLVVALALIPEAISFSIIAGVDPRLGLFSSFIMAVAIAFVGGRPAMITAATAAVALVVAPVAQQHGVDYLLATVILGGLLQLLLGVLGVARLMRFIPRSVMVGFVNSLAILIFTAQVPHLVGVPWLVYPLVALGIGIMVLIPRVLKAVPAPLIAIAVLTTITVLSALNVPTVGDEGELPESLPALLIPNVPVSWETLGIIAPYALAMALVGLIESLIAIAVLTTITVLTAINVPTVGDEGELPESLPALLIPNVPFSWETLGIIAPYALAMALVGLIESLMTAKLVDDITDTRSSKTREAWGQGVANVLSGMFGGMGGCAMIGQTMINVKASGARTRISTFLAGVFLLILVVVLGDLVAIIPMAALVAVMIMVSVLTFDWHSVRPATLRRMPRSETLVMVSTVAAVVLTHNLAIGVGLGVVVASVLFARRVAHFATVEREVVEGGAVAYYTVVGELFFASSNDLTTQFEYSDDPDDIVIDVSRSHIWDASTVAALDAIETKYAGRGKRVRITGMNEASADMHKRLAGNLGAGS